MALSNAEKQARWRERNQTVLTDDARTIAGKLIDMEDQAQAPPHRQVRQRPSQASRAQPTRKVHGPGGLCESQRRFEQDGGASASQII